MVERGWACILWRMPPSAYFVGSAIFHYLGPSFAVLLFARVQPLGVAWLRIVSAALIFALWRRPWRAMRSRLVVAWGVVLAVMNCCFYLAIDRLPLGTVAAIEFLPVIVLAALGARSVRNALALALAVPGVYLLTDVQLAGEPLGVALAFANALLFALYIMLARATYALMVSLLPATATVIGIVVLAQIPTWIEVLGVGLVVAGVAVHREPADATKAPEPDPAALAAS